MSWLSNIGKGLAGAIPIVGPLIAGGLGYAGQQSTNVANAKQAAATNAFNAAEAEKNRQFQAEQSSTSWQRGVEDMRKAGLNPALAYQQGGASSPTGSTASGVMAKFDSSAGAGISSAQRAAEFANQVETSKLDRANKAADANLTNAQADNLKMQMTAQLEELKSRIALNSASASRAASESGNIQSTFAARMKVLESEAARNVASAGEARARTGTYGPQIDLLKASLPAAQNAAAAANTWWGKNVVPYLNSGESVSRMFSPWKLLFSDK